MFLGMEDRDLEHQAGLGAEHWKVGLCPSPGDLDGARRQNLELGVEA